MRQSLYNQAGALLFGSCCAGTAIAQAASLAQGSEPVLLQVTVSLGLRCSDITTLNTGIRTCTLCICR